MDKHEFEPQSANSERCRVAIWDGPNYSRCGLLASADIHSPQVEHGIHEQPTINEIVNAYDPSLDAQRCVKPEKE